MFPARTTESNMEAVPDDDAAALVGATRALLADETENGAAIEGGAVALVLQHLSARPMASCIGVATTLAKEVEADAASREKKVLVGVLQLVRQRLDGEGTDEAALKRMVVAHGKHLAAELTTGATPDDLKTPLLWADAIVDIASRFREEEVPVATDVEPNGEAETPWVVQLVREFLRIHQHSPANRVDFRLMTLVWKNLNKLCALHRGTILHHCGGEKLANPLTEVSINDLFEGAAAGLAQTAQRLRSLELSSEDDDFVQELKLLRLFLRAFQGQFVQFVDAMVAQVECGVALAVDAIAAVIPVTEGLKTKSELVQHDAQRVLQCAVTLVETMAKSDKLQASTRSFVGTLLWQPHSKMASLVAQTRSQHVDDVQLDERVTQYLQWGHLVAVASFSAIYGVSECSNFTMESVATVIKDSPGYATVARLFKRYRECTRRVLVQYFTATRSLFLDIILDSLVAQAQPLKTMQLFLIEHTLHPDPPQRFLVWELWREFVCFIWDDSVSRSVFSTLLTLTHTKNHNGTRLDPVVRDELLGLLAFLYPELGPVAKQECLHFVASAFNSVCTDGPGHKYTAKMAASLDLLEALGTSLLVEYNHSEKEEWIAEYLPVALECVGGVLDSLDQGVPSMTAEKLGFVRMLDTALLIIRAIFEDSEESELQGPHGLSGMLLPMCTETVAQLAKLSSLGGDGRSSTSISKSFTRTLGSCLFLLTKLASSMKANRSNSCVQLIKDLLSILLSQHEISPHSLVIALFIRDALGDIFVAASDADIVWQMLGQLFHKLSALQFGLQIDPAVDSLTPPQSVCLEAFYAVLARSNLPDFAEPQRSFKSWIVPHAQSRFAAYLQGMCEGPSAESNIFCSESYAKFDESQAQRLNLSMTSSSSIANKKSVRDQSLEISNRGYPPGPNQSTEDIGMEDDIEGAKRVKWEEFASTYWEVHDSLSSLSSPRQQETFIERLSEKDLDQATAALRNLLGKRSKTT